MLRVSCVRAASAVAWSAKSMTIDTLSRTGIFFWYA